MADDKTKKRLDRTRINIHEPYKRSTIGAINSVSRQRC